MPNYVTNYVKLNCDNEDKIAELLAGICNDDVDVDFNRIIPMPESLNISSGSNTDLSIAVYNYVEKNDDTALAKMLTYPWVEKEKIKTVEELYQYFVTNRDIEQLMKDGATYISNIEKYGCPTWYEWCNRNWGTKWNAMDPYVDDAGFGFTTAWSGVVNLMCTLSEKYPDVELDYSYADEDFGHNCGRFTIKEGEVKDMYLPDGGSEEAYDLAAEILGYDFREEEDFYDEEDDEDEV